MIRICCSSFHTGEKIFGEKEPLEDKSETHGFCPDCLRKEMMNVEGQFNEREENSNG